MSSSDEFPGIPQTRDSAPNWAADTDPVGPVTPELALVDPGLTSSGDNNEVTMSSMQFGDAQVPVEAQQPLTVQPLQPLVPPAPAPEAVSPAPPEPVQAPAVPVGDMRDVPLGTLVFRAGLLPEERLEEALQEGMKTGKRLGEVLLERGWVSESDLGRLLAGQKGLPFVELDASAVDPTAPPLLPPEKARLHGALPIGFQGGVPVVAVADPSNDLVVENVRRALACEPVLVVAGRDDLHNAINQVYGGQAPVQQAVEPVVQPAVEPVVEQVAEPVAPAPAVEPPAVPVADPVLPVAFAEPAPVAEAVEPLAPVVEPVAPAVEPVAPAVEPVAPVVTEPVPVLPSTPVEAAQNGDGIWLGQPEAQPETAPVQQPVLSVEPVAPVAPVEPVAPVLGQPEPVPVAPLEAPVAPVVAEPVAEAVVEPAPATPEPVPQPDTQASWGVLLRLANGERLELGAFTTEAEAVERARAVVAQAGSQDGWPFVNGRFIRPDVIVSVDLVELEVTRWLGSQARAAALNVEQH